jgi:hypothetical protein
MAERKGAYRVLVGKLEGRRPRRRPIDCRVLLKWGFIRNRMGPYTEFIWFRRGTDGGLL